MIFDPNNPDTWPVFKPLIIAHDVGCTRDRSTAVIGGNCPLGTELVGIKEFVELEQGLYGSARASALAAIDHRYNRNALIVADVSNDATYAEVLLQTFGARVIGLHISRNGDGMTFDPRQVGRGVIPVYTIGRTHLIELFHSELQSGRVRMVDGPMARRAYEQLANLETEVRETGIVYKCLPGQHDDLGISCAMLAWAARHPHLPRWVGTYLAPRRPQWRRPEGNPWGAWT
jgi:hypothetical protein